ncbi:MAG: RHS repeat protein, partial [Opitutales bacterium]|nr:RHS repeat protein [Opitutales bacterium]
MESLGEAEKKSAYFSPFSDWAANGSAESGILTISGANDMRGWKFSYAASKLRKIEGPSGRSIEFAYEGGRPVSVSQNGKAFVEIKYGEGRAVSQILINGVTHSFEYAESGMRMLPETLAGSEAEIKVQMLKKVGICGLNPLEFSYNAEGYLTRIARGDFSDDIEVEIETLADRKEYLQKLADAKKEKKPLNKIFKDKVDGRILSDSFFKYEYPSKTFSDIELTNRKGQSARYSYDFRRGIFEVEDFSGKKTSTYLFMRYDVAYNGKIRQILDGQKRQLANFRYDKDSGKITRARDFLQNDTNFKYDGMGRLSLVERRAADSEKALPFRAFAYEKSSLFPSKISELDESGAAVKTVEIFRDKFSNPVKISDGENTALISYNGFGYPVKIVNSFGQETRLAYDEFNRQISKEFEGLKTKIIYGKNAEIKEILSECGGVVLAFTRINYDANGYAASYTDQDGNVKKLERDVLGRVLKENFPDNTQVNYAYDELGNLAQVIDQNGNKIKFAWNEFGLDSRTTAVGQI